MDTIPTGTVTLLFSDMEGSTRLLSRLGDRYVEALDAQRRILRQMWSDFDGTELGTEGDSFYVAFSTADGAVAAVAAAQRELAEFPWPGGEPVRVRMGVHTGSPLPHDGAYVGMDVHRAARIAAAAHGGQVTLSATTAQLAAESLPAGSTLRDLGTHRLKDLPRPEHIYQLDIEGLDNEFPPLRTLGATSTLPLLDAPPVGREAEIAELSRLLEDPAARLLTLTGPGGTGKTTLSIDLARRRVHAFADGVYFVPLAAAADTVTMWRSIAATLDLGSDGDEQDAVSDYLSERNALLVLDNLEQLAGADDAVAHLLEAGRQLVVVVTTRQPLHIVGEQEFAVPPLALPIDSSAVGIADSAAVQLFVRHAHRVRADFALTDDNGPDVAAICRQLDGLPLAIELAAARSKLLSPHAILTRLGAALDITGHDSTRTGRHRTLRETIDWSYRLLNPAQQAFFARMGAFADGGDLAALADVCLTERNGADDALELALAVVDASLATVSEGDDGEPRLQLLETVRIFAREQLAEIDPVQTAFDRHSLHYLGIVKASIAQLTTRDHLRARAQLDAEYANICAALTWTLRAPDTDADQAGRIPTGIALAAAAGSYWNSKGRLDDSEAWTRAAIDLGETDSRDLARCLAVLSNCLRFHGRDPEGRLHSAVESVAMHRRLGGLDGLPYALRTLAAVVWETGDLARARALYEEVIAVVRSVGRPDLIQVALSELGGFESDQGNLARSLELETEAVSIAVASGDSSAEAACRQNLACTLRLLGRVDEAAQMLRGVVPVALAIQEGGTIVSLAEDYAAVLAELGEDYWAARLVGAADGWHASDGSPRSGMQDVEIGPALDQARARLSADEWAEAYEAGRAGVLEDELANALQATPPDATQASSSALRRST